MKLTCSSFIILITFGNLVTSYQHYEDQSLFDYKCFLCKYTGDLIIDYHDRGAKPNSLFNIITTLCTYLGGEDKEICRGMIQNIGEQIFAILDVNKQTNGTITSRDICGMVLGGSCAHKSKRLYHWSLDIPDLDNEPLTPPPKWPKTSNKTSKILHLSDPHVQLDYTIGASNSCGKVICCSSSDPIPTDPTKQAGKFGDYKCDLPLNTLDTILSHARDTHPDIEMIFLTGDFPAHDVWRQDRKHNKASSKAIVDSVTRHFPQTAVYPAIGNHEMFPVNMFPDEDQPVPQIYDPSWLYNNLADLYQHWLPDTAQQNTLRDSGYYSVMANEKLKIISINANFCNNFNFWLLLNFNDPHDHLHWFYRQLHKAETKKQKVFVLGHIAPGTHSCLGRWSHEYNRLIRRFKNTVVGQFFGHTHDDEFQIFFNGTEAINMAFLAPSETTLDGINPAYRIYEMDKDSNMLVKHQTYWMNLTEANQNGQATIRLEYDTKIDLGLKDMSPESWHVYVKNLSQDNVAFDQFRQRYYRQGPAYENSKCDKTCRQNMICSLLTSEAQLLNKPQVCKDLENDNSWWNYVFNKL